MRSFRFREKINMRNKPALEYLKTEAYKDQIPKFKSVLADMGKQQGWGLGDIQKRFSNEMWDYLVYSEIAGTEQERNGEKPLVGRKEAVW